MSVKANRCVQLKLTTTLLKSLTTNLLFKSIVSYINNKDVVKVGKFLNFLYGFIFLRLEI